MLDQIKELRSQGKSPEEILEVLNKPSIVRTNPERVSMGDSIAALKAAGVDPNTVAAAFKAAGPMGEAGLTKWAATGLHFNHPETLDLLTVLVGHEAIPTTAMTTLLQLSEWYLTPWQAAGNQGEMQLADLNRIIQEDQITNAKAFFCERVTLTDDDATIIAKWSQAKTDAGAG